MPLKPVIMMLLLIESDGIVVIAAAAVVVVSAAAALVNGSVIALTIAENGFDAASGASSTVACETAVMMESACRGVMADMTG